MEELINQGHAEGVAKKVATIVEKERKILPTVKSLVTKVFEDKKKTMLQERDEFSAKKKAVDADFPWLWPLWLGPLSTATPSGFSYPH